MDYHKLAFHQFSRHLTPSELSLAEPSQKKVCYTLPPSTLDLPSRYFTSSRPQRNHRSIARGMVDIPFCLALMSAGLIFEMSTLSNKISPLSSLTRRVLSSSTKRKSAAANVDLSAQSYQLT